MLGMLLFGAALATLLLFIVNLSVNTYVTNVYLSEENRIKRDREYKAELQDYAIANRLSSNDVDKLAEWAQDNRYLYLLIYKNDKLLFESGQPDANRDELIADEVNRGSYPIYMTDGVILISMVDNTENLYYTIANVGSIIAAVITFFIVMWCYFYSITRRIGKLGKEVTAVAEGDIRHPISINGEDEITGLSMDVEYMRSSMLENLEKEHAALESNRELITAMSHDIRTPLTVLLGYLDIMKLNAPDGVLGQYIEASEKTALRLKKMSDDMFNYFLAYGGSVDTEIQECNARTLVEQMLSGHIFLLRERGYTIRYNFEDKDADFLDNVMLVTDPPQLMRIVENIFSNVMKYADREREIEIFVDSDTDEMTIKVSNYVAKNIDEALQSGVGLRSCMKLANAMDIRFSSGEEDGVFTSEMYIPIVPEILWGEMEDGEEEGGFNEWLKSVSEKLKKFFSELWRKMKKFAVSSASKMKSGILKLWSKITKKK